MRGPRTGPIPPVDADPPADDASCTGEAPPFDAPPTAVEPPVEDAPPPASTVGGAGRSSFEHPESAKTTFANQSDARCFKLFAPVFRQLAEGSAPDGTTYCPINSGVSVSTSRSRNTKGRFSSKKTGGGGGRARPSRAAEGRPRRCRRAPPVDRQRGLVQDAIGSSIAVCAMKSPSGGRMKAISTSRPARSKCDHDPRDCALEAPDRERFLTSCDASLAAP